MNNRFISQSYLTNAHNSMRYTPRIAWENIKASLEAFLKEQLYIQSGFRPGVPEEIEQMTRSFLTGLVSQGIIEKQPETRISKTLNLRRNPTIEEIERDGYARLPYTEQPGQPYEDVVFSGSVGGLEETQFHVIVNTHGIEKLAYQFVSRANMVNSITEVIQKQELTIKELELKIKNIYKDPLLELKNSVATFKLI